MFAHIRPAFVMMLLFTVLTGLAYPLFMTAVAQVVVGANANGSLIIGDGKVVGSARIGQKFAADKYFHGRPSAAGDGYDPLASSGSNLGPTSKKLLDRVHGDADALRAASGAKILPGDSVTASASGLDPDISPRYAKLQVKRVATARGVGVDKIEALLDRQIERPFLGFIGEPRVNVLQLNLALDAELKPSPG